MTSIDDEKKLDLLMKINDLQCRYPDLPIPHARMSMPLQELNRIYQYAENAVYEFHINKSLKEIATMKQVYKQILTEKLLNPDSKEADTNLKVLFDSISEYMTENGITTENTKRAFIDLFVELSTGLIMSKYGEPFDGDQMITTFCDKYNLTIDLTKLYIIIQMDSLYS